jgi:hypothetical protein
MNEPNFTLALIILEVIFSLMLLNVLYRAGARKPMLLILGGVFAVWLGSMYYLLKKAFFSATGMPQLSFTLGVFMPVIVGYLAYLFWQPLKQVIHNIPTQDFLCLQIWRAAFGILFFFTAALPVWFQYIGGLGDITAGLGALLAFIALKKQTISERTAIIRGNLLGVLDFIIVLNLGVFVVLQNQSPDIMFDLIPLYVVPLFILLHVFSLQRLGRTGITL